MFAECEHMFTLGTCNIAAKTALFAVNICWMELAQQMFETNTCRIMTAMRDFMFAGWWIDSIETKNNMCHLIWSVWNTSSFSLLLSAPCLELSLGLVMPLGLLLLVLLVGCLYIGDNPCRSHCIWSCCTSPSVEVVQRDVFCVHYRCTTKCFSHSCCVACWC